MVGGIGKYFWLPLYSKDKTEQLNDYVIKADYTIGNRHTYSMESATYWKNCQNIKPLIHKKSKAQLDIVNIF